MGSIEVGKFADFTELSADPYTVEPSDLEATVRVLGTWINGLLASTPVSLAVTHGFDPALGSFCC